MNLKELSFDISWTLFLDRDGVINRRIPGDYVQQPENFVFLPGVLEAMDRLAKVFGKIIMVSNQQGIGKGLMTENQLRYVHDVMLKEIENAGGRIDGIYFSPYLDSANHPDRKPGPGMAYKAKQDFPEIDFHHSVMVGDTFCDMEFGRNLGMVTVLVGNETDNVSREPADYTFEDLLNFAKAIK